MRVVIAGATGFIGRALSEALHKDYEVVALSRDARRAARLIGDVATVLEWDGRSTGSWVRQAEGALAIINLAGENLATGRWTLSKKSGILQSRVNSRRAVVDAVKQVEDKPRVVIHGSAVGYYGIRGDEELDENSSSGKGFLADVCRKSELLLDELEATGVRWVIARSGVVLGQGGGALANMIRPFRFHLGGYPGNGGQWLSWISLDDEVAALRFLMENEHLQGAYNLTSPQPVTMKQCCKTLGAVLGRSAWLPVPAFALRLAYGEMADEMLLAGQRVLPGRLLEAGFEFRYADLKSALTGVL
jgi:uncharacterized protein (TIGR01777 family)